MVGYVRQSATQIVPGQDITAEPLAAEFNALASAFGTTGHNHSGTSGNGPKLDLTTSITGVISDAQHGSKTTGTLHAAVTTTVNGFMSAADKVKLNGIATGANVYTPLTAVQTRDLILTVDGAGSGLDADLLDGQHGSYYLDLTNATGTLPTDSSHGNRGGAALHAAVTTSINGFMSAADKVKLDGIAAGAQVNDLAFVTATNNSIATINSNLALRLRVDAAQGLTDAQKGQAIANIGGSVLSSFRNKLINGDFNVWQRGGSFNIPAGGFLFVADRWLIANTTNQPVVISRVTFTIGSYEDVPGSPTYAMAANFSTAPTTGSLNIIQRIEDVRTLEGKRTTARAYISGPASSGVLDVDVTQVFGTGGSPSANVITSKTSLDVATISNPTPTIRKKNAIIDVPSLAGKTVGTNGNDYIQLRWMLSARQAGLYVIAHTSLVEGDATTEVDPFSPRHIQQENTLCQRYFQRIGQWQLTGYNSSGGYIYETVARPVLMRAYPADTITDLTGGINVSGIGVSASTPYMMSVAVSVVSTGAGLITYWTNSEAEL